MAMQRCQRCAGCCVETVTTSHSLFCYWQKKKREKSLYCFFSPKYQYWPQKLVEPPIQIKQLPVSRELRDCFDCISKKQYFIVQLSFSPVDLYFFLLFISYFFEPVWTENNNFTHKKTPQVSKYKRMTSKLNFSSNNESNSLSWKLLFSNIWLEAF